MLYFCQNIRYRNVGIRLLCLIRQGKLWGLLDRILSLATNDNLLFNKVVFDTAS